MSVLDNIERSRADVRDVFREKKFVIRPDVSFEWFMSENSGYSVYMSVKCGFEPGSWVVLEQYEKKLGELYDEISEYPGIEDCSPVWVAKRGISASSGYVMDYAIYFGIRGSVMSVYKAMRMLYGLCSVLWRENGGTCVPVALIYHHHGELQWSYMRYDAFFDFYDFYRNRRYMYEAWKVFAMKLVRRPRGWVRDSETEFRRCVRRCSAWYERVEHSAGRRKLVKTGEFDVCLDSESISGAGSITSKGSDFERFCGQFLIG